MSTISDILKLRAAQVNSEMRAAMNLRLNDISREAVQHAFEIQRDTWYAAAKMVEEIEKAIEEGNSSG